MKTRPVYVATGEAKDQETIVRLRPYIEDEVTKTLSKYNKSFSKTKLVWNMISNGNFKFKLECYA